MAQRQTKARIAVRRIISDMTGRAGGDHWWKSIDYATRTEILDAWEEIVQEALSEYRLETS